jgi:hypothetical protein
MKPGKFRLRKTSDIHQECPIYEIVDEDRIVLLDVTKTDSGMYEACIMDNQGEGRVVELSVLLGLIQEVQRRIDADE